MRGLQPMQCIGRPHLARLHHKSEQPRRQAQKKKRIAQTSSQGKSHRLDGKWKGIIFSVKFAKL
jgi:hypothetical protein